MLSVTPPVRVVHYHLLILICSTCNNAIRTVRSKAVKSHIQWSCPSVMQKDGSIEFRSQSEACNFLAKLQNGLGVCEDGITFSTWVGLALSGFGIGQFISLSQTWHYSAHHGRGQGYGTVCQPEVPIIQHSLIQVHDHSAQAVTPPQAHNNFGR